ncbi:glutathione S-transferase [Ferrimonas sediminum]|uniref:Glutathione S-transferase n=1 Tax=Ferrimonas sediminum TaxID=718193 RepID=A0A1G8TRD1_9GAMM|nr:glutathione S-transferase [Ferrimonas sediminum]SDJ44069.1 glutathione S-transferase [Ferrimonas sediminum]
MMRPILYSFRRCPYAMRARLALDYAHIELELREVVLKHKPAHLRRISPKATVPVLQLSDHWLLDQSLDIMLWALSRNDPQRWWPTEPQAQVQALARIQYNDGRFKYWLDRYKYADRFPEHSQRYYRLQGEQWLRQLDRQLSQATWLGGQQPDLSDMALMPFVRQFAHVDPDWFAAAPYPHLRRWLEHLKASPAFARIMAKYPPYQPDDPVIVWPTDAITT